MLCFIRLGGLSHREQRERELANEIEANLQMHIDDNLSSGMTPQQARREAILKLGGVEPTLQAYRERSTLPFLESLLQDLRFAIRQLAKNPGFTFTAILVLALGICASVSIFAFVDAALIKPLPYENPSRLVALFEHGKMFPRSNLSYRDYVDWKKLNRVFGSLDAFGGRGYLLSTPAGAEPVRGIRVSDGFFQTLGVAPVLGRAFSEGEDQPGAPRTVILSYATWQKRFGGRPDALGETVTLSSAPYTIVGVLPQDFHFALEGSPEFWTTMQAVGNCDLRRTCHNIFAVARLKDGISIQTASANLQSIAQQLEKQYPDSNRGRGAVVMSLGEAIVGDILPILLVLWAGAGLLLLIACINVSSLLLVRSESRRREMAVRGALGASPARLIRQFATEALVLVTAGTALGIACAEGAMQLLIKLISTDMLAGMPYLQGLGLNPRVMGFAGSIALFATLLFSITPSLRLGAAELHDGLAEGGRTAAGTTWRRLGANLVVLELATAVVLLVGAGLLGKSSYRLMHVDVGFAPDHLATVDIAVPDTTYPQPEQKVALGRQIVGRIASLPGVKSVGISSLLALSGNGNTDWIRFVGRSYNGQHNEVNQRDVSSDYLTTLRAKLLRGRYFTDAEDASKPLVVVINRTMAEHFFPGEDPIGKQFGDTDLSPKSIKQIIGVIDNVQEGTLDSETFPSVYYPFNQDPDSYFTVAVRTSQAEDSILPTLIAAIHQIDPNIGTLNESTMNDRINDSQTAYLHRSSAWLVGGFAATALLLGVIGLYGVVAYSVSRRTREIGVRMALGAQRTTVARFILKEAGQLVALGITLGILGSQVTTTLLRGLLFGVHSWDVATLATVSFVLGLSALLASYIPARRAASINPTDALRAE